MGRVTTRVRRTRLDVESGATVERTDTVAVEEPLEIRVDDAPLTTTMRTPGDDFDLAIGHLLTEGLLHGADEVATLMHCTDLDESGSPTFNVVDVTLAPGYLSQEEIMALYEQESGRSLEGFGFHLGLACFKLAGISEGVRYRHINRQTVGEGFEDSGNTVPLLIELGLESLKEYK